MATNKTKRERMTCGKCREVHTNDCLNLYTTPGVYGDPERVCFFCDHGTELGPANGTPTRRDGKINCTREEDRLEAEEEIANG